MANVSLPKGPNIGPQAPKVVALLRDHPAKLPSAKFWLISSRAKAQRNPDTLAPLSEDSTSLPRLTAPVLTAAAEASPSPTMAAVITVQSTVTAPSSSFMKLRIIKKTPLFDDPE